MNNVIENEFLIKGRYTYGDPTILAWGERVAKVIVGNFSSIAKNVTIILQGEHRTEWVTNYPFPKSGSPWFDVAGNILYKQSKGDVIIGNDVWICHGVTILSGLKIGDGAVIGAGAVISKDVPPYAVVVGNPAKVVKYRFDKKTIRHLLEEKWWDWSDEKIKENMGYLCSEPI